MSTGYGEENIYRKYGQPTLDLVFTGAKKSLTDRVSNVAVEFSRTTTATYVGSDGLIKTAASNEARFDHDPATGESLGLLIEESRTNYTKDGTGFTVTSGNGRTAPSRGTFSSTSAVNPTGSAGTTLFTTDVSSGISIGISGGDASQGSVGNAMSMFVKPNGITKIFLTTYSTANFQGAYFDLTGEGSVAGVQQSLPLDKCFIHSYPNGWYRIGVSSYSGVPISYSCLVWEYDASNNPQFSSVTGDGTSGFYIWGWQNELGGSDFWTSVIPTSGSTVTRSADVASMTGTNFSSWFNSSEGSITVQHRLPVVYSSNQTVLTIKGDALNTLYMRANNTEHFTIVSDSTVSTQIKGGNYSANTLNSVAGGYALNNFRVSTNGSLSALDTSGLSLDAAATSMTQLGLGAAGANPGTSDTTLTISRLTYWPKRLPDSDLQSLTE